MKPSLHPFSLPLRTPVRTAQQEIARREGFLLRLVDDDVVGYGEATPLLGWTESFRACELGLDVATTALAEDDPAAALDACADNPAARHAVDLAVLDARARRAGLPLHRFLGADRRVDTVPVNATIADTGIEETVAAAETAVADGFTCLKLKVGSSTPETDARRVRRVHEATPSGTGIRVDANAAWTADAAHAFIDALGPVSLEYLEQPLDEPDLAGHATLRDSGIAIALDESLTAHGVSAVLDAGAADAVVLKPMAIGGIERTHRIARTAREDGVTPVLSTTVDAAVARTAATHLAATLPDPAPSGLATGPRLRSDVATDFPTVHDGVIDVPEGNGNGIAPTIADDA